MPKRFIQPARGFNDASPPVISGKYATGQTFKKGALLLIDSAGELTECAADPTLVSGLALEPAGKRPGFEIAGGVTQVTYRAQEVSYVPADDKVIYSMRAVNGATDPVTPAQTNVGESYGALKDSDGIWTLDIAEVTVLVFTIVDIDIDSKIFFCKFHPTALA